jgi:hypothetical protein
VRSRNDGYRWIDSLARWSVGGRDGSRPPVADRAAPDPAGGTTRRRALRSAAGAGVLALLGPMRFLDPASAGANVVTHAQECTAEATQIAQEDFEACFQNPLENYLTAGEHLDRAKKLLRTAKSPAERARLKKVIEFQTGQRRKASKAMEFCNKALLSDAAEGAAKCDAANPSPTESGGGKNPSGSGCEPGNVLCGEECCDLQFAFCQGCAGSPICCRINGNCCPGSSS